MERIILAFLLTEVVMVPLLIYGRASPLMLFFPGFLYLLSRANNDQKNNLIKTWLVLLPSTVLLFIFIAFLIKRMPIDYFRWLSVFITCSILVYLSLDRQLQLDKMVDSAHLLFFQLTLLLCMNALVILSSSFYKHGEIIEEYAVLDLISWFLLCISMLLNFHFLYARKKEQRTFGMAYEATRMERIHKEIIFIFEKKRVFLDKTFDKAALSKLVGVDRKELNLFFDRYLEKDFKLFMAEYRVYYALELMQEEHKKTTLTGIAEQSGFQSRASFNRYFKIILGVSPSQYDKI